MCLENQYWIWALKTEFVCETLSVPHCHSEFVESFERKGSHSNFTCLNKELHLVVSILIHLQNENRFRFSLQVLQIYFISRSCSVAGLKHERQYLNTLIKALNSKPVFSRLTQTKRENEGKLKWHKNFESCGCFAVAVFSCCSTTGVTPHSAEWVAQKLLGNCVTLSDGSWWHKRLA